MSSGKYLMLTGLTLEWLDEGELGLNHKSQSSGNGASNIGLFMGLSSESLYIDGAILLR